MTPTSAMKGMNPLHVEAVSADLHTLATSITSAADGALADVEALSWLGDDRDMFYSEIRTLVETGKALAVQATRMSEHVLGEVASQRATSAAR